MVDLDFFESFVIISQAPPRPLYSLRPLLVGRQAGTGIAVLGRGFPKGVQLTAIHCRLCRASRCPQHRALFSSSHSISTRKINLSLIHSHSLSWIFYLLQNNLLSGILGQKAKVLCLRPHRTRGRGGQGGREAHAPGRIWVSH